MKLIHTSDWHLGHILYNLDRNAEHEAFLKQLCELVQTEKPDALLVSGDIFDSAQPSIPAQRLYNRMMIEIARTNPDTIFIDEGFGTLSPKCLEGVYETLASLKQVVGKKVGIIGHVEYLKENIHPQILVEPIGNGLSIIQDPS